MVGLRTSLQVSPMTAIGVCPVCAASNRLYSRVWFLWWVKRSKCSSTNTTLWLLWSPTSGKSVAWTKELFITIIIPIRPESLLYSIVELLGIVLLELWIYMHAHWWYLCAIIYYEENYRWGRFIYIYICIYHIASHLIQQICMYKVQTPYINLMGWAISWWFCWDLHMAS